MHPWVWAVIGGILIGLSASLLLLLNGRIAGISGIAGGLLSPTRGDSGWRVAFLLGLVGGGLVTVGVVPTAFGAPAPVGLGATAVAGLLVGFGTRLANGCTSGHGVCGLARGSARSLAATGTFMLAAAMMVFVVRHVVGGQTP